MINNALQDLFAIHESSAGDTTIPSFGPPNYSFKEFKLGCPRVVVHYSDEDKYHVMYQIRILSGKFAVYLAFIPRVDVPTDAKSRLKKTGTPQRFSHGRSKTGFFLTLSTLVRHISLDREVYLLTSGSSCRR